MNSIEELAKQYGKECHSYCLAKSRLIDFGCEWDDREHEQSADGLFYFKPTAIARNMRKAGERYLAQQMEHAWYMRQAAFNLLMDEVGGKRDESSMGQMLDKAELRMSDLPELSESDSIACLLPGNAYEAMKKWMINKWKTRYKIPEHIFLDAAESSNRQEGD